MRKIALFQNKTIEVPWVLLIAFFAGMFIVSEGLGRVIVLSLTISLPILFFLAQRPTCFLLKCMIIVLFFVPFQQFPFLNPFKCLNPLIILGVILCIKLFSDEEIKKKLKSTRFRAIDITYFIFLLSAGISSYFAISVLGSLNWLFFSVTTGYVVYRAISILSPHEIKSILRFFVFTASASALFGIWEYHRGHSLIYGYLMADRLTLPLGHYLASGLVLATVFPFSLALYIETQEKIFAATSLILFWAIILTFSRGSWFALVIGVLIMFFLFRSQLKLRLLVTFIALAALIGITPTINQSIIRRLNVNESGRYSSLNVRRKAAPVAFSILQDRPFFGVGPFNAGRYKEKYTNDWNLKDLSFENTYLGILVDLGYVGAGILFFFGCLVVKHIVFNPPGVQQTYIYGSAAVSSLIILLINMGTFNFDSYRIFHFIIWFYLGLNLYLANNKK